MRSGYDIERWDVARYRELLPSKVPENATKYSRGHVLVVAGSVRYPGAAVLATRAAARSGAGYVTLAVPNPVLQTAQAHLVCSPVVGCTAIAGAFAADAAPLVLELSKRAQSVIAGPGISITGNTPTFLTDLIEHVTCPLLLDADALTMVAHGLVAVVQERAPQGLITILTPHEGEALRLLSGLGESDAEASRKAVTPLSGEAREALAGRLAEGYRCIVLLKGPRTLIADPQSGRMVENPSGTAALATAGTGDVLSGIIGSLLACGLPAYSAAALGAYIHGLAGIFAARTCTMMCTTAEDVIGALPDAFRNISEGKDE